MQFRLLDSLGTTDARKCNADFGASIDLKRVGKGDSIDLPDAAAKYLSGKYPALLEPIGKVRGEAKQAEVTAPSK